VQSQQGSASHSFLLDDDSSNPFNANEVQISMNDKELYSEMPIPEPLKDNKAFEFLARDLKIATLSVQQPAQQ
jgi:myosin V